ncbi:MAG: hypothetical protein R3C10_07610 [Pirellulales bacterium]
MLNYHANQSNRSTVPRPGAARRGISLIEVLIATFIAAIGLLGLISLIPVGKYQIFEGTKSDRGATMGRAAVRELQVRGMLNPKNWLPVTNTATATYSGYGNDCPWYDWDAPSSPQLPSNSQQSRYRGPAIPTDNGNSVCIDPLFISRQYTVDSNNDGVPDSLPTSVPPQLLGQFPYPLDAEQDRLKQGGLDVDNAPGQFPNPPRMTRVSLRAQSILPSTPSTIAVPRMDVALAERVFSLGDDLLFEKASSDVRPHQLFAASSSNTPLHRQFAGDYTWLVTVTPEERGAIASQDYNLQRRLYTVSVVVFYKRQMVPPLTARSDRNDGPPSERLVLADLQGGSLGYGGGDVRLWLPSQWASSSPGNPTDMPNTRAGQWLMLAHWVPDPFNGPSRAVFRWYRVVASEGEPVVNTATGEPEQYVSVVGPDLVPWQGSGSTVHAALFDGVVAVYQKTMQLDR